MAALPSFHELVTGHCTGKDYDRGGILGYWSTHLMYDLRPHENIAFVAVLREAGQHYALGRFTQTREALHDYRRSLERTFVSDEWGHLAQHALPFAGLFELVEAELALLEDAPVSATRQAHPVHERDDGTVSLAAYRAARREATN